MGSGRTTVSWSSGEDVTFLRGVDIQPLIGYRIPPPLQVPQLLRTERMTWFLVNLKSYQQKFAEVMTRRNKT
jgi:hypothetical protein